MLGTKHIFHCVSRLHMAVISSIELVKIQLYLAGSDTLHDTWWNIWCNNVTTNPLWKSWTHGKLPHTPSRMVCRGCSGNQSLLHLNRNDLHYRGMFHFYSHWHKVKRYVSEIVFYCHHILICMAISVHILNIFTDVVNVQLTQLSHTFKSIHKVAII